MKFRSLAKRKTIKRIVSISCVSRKGKTKAEALICSTGFELSLTSISLLAIVLNNEVKGDPVSAFISNSSGRN